MSAYRIHASAIVIVGVLMLASCPFPSRADETSSQTSALDTAIATIRNIDPAKMSEDEKRLKAVQMQVAWSTILSSGKTGIERIHKELAAIDRAGERDDYFKLGTASLLWNMGGLDESGTIAAIWQSTPVATQYNYTFYTALEAAATKDPRALPMLKAILHDEEGRVYFKEHAMYLVWPWTHQFVWGTYGPGTRSAFLEVLSSSQDDVTLKSAVLLAAKDQCIEALPLIRKIAHDGEGTAREFAIEWLGEYGHPGDFDWLVGGLKQEASSLVVAHLRALAVYEDLRAVPEIVSLLKADDESIRMTAIGALNVLVNDESVRALHDHASSSYSETEKNACEDLVARVIRPTGTDWTTYLSKTAPERDALIRQGDTREDEYRMKPDDRRLTREELLEAFKLWKEAGRITGGKYEWVESRHVLSVATPDDLDALLDVRSALFARLSDECMYEVEILNDLIRRIGRSRYRKNVGICQAVEKIEPTAANPSKE